MPFELEMMEGALVVATNKLDGELVSVSSKVSEVLGKLITEATPLNLDELRRIKSSLVEVRRWDARSPGSREQHAGGSAAPGVAK